MAIRTCLPSAERRSSIRSHCDNRRFSAGKETVNGGAFTIESEYSNYNGLGGYRRGLCQEPGRVRTGKLSFSESSVGKWVSSKSSASIAKAEFTHGTTPSYRPEDHRSQLQLRHQAVQCARDDVLQGQRYNRLNPISGRRESASRSRCKPSFSQFKNEGVNL